MADRFETILDAHLAQILADKLGLVLQREGFRQTLHLAEPHIREFQRDSALVSLQIGHAGSHDRAVVIESESVDVKPLVEDAARDAVLELSSRMLGALPWVDRATATKRIESVLSEVLGCTQTK